MLRITRCPRGPDRSALLLEGRLTAREIDALEAELRRVSPRSEPLVLELSGVRYVDEVGARTLVALHRQGITLEGGSAFVREILRGVSR